MPGAFLSINLPGMQDEKLSAIHLIQTSSPSLNFSIKLGKWEMKIEQFLIVNRKD